MCLGIPAQVIRLDPQQPRCATVSVGGVERAVNLSCVLEPGVPPESLLGSWVLVHVGFAMARIDEAEAARTLALLAELGEAQEELQRMGGNERAQP